MVDLRRMMRERREALDAPFLTAAARDLAAAVAAALPEVAAASRVGLYAAIRGELGVDRVDCGEAARFLPIVQRAEKTLRFGPAHGPLRRGSFGIAEPAQGDVAIGDLDVVFVPGLAFDRHGNRLGWGAGHYDRALAGVRDARPLLIGVAHDFQLVDELDAQPWDVPMHAVATPTRVIDLR